MRKNSDLKIAIVGYGHVGKAMNKLFKDAIIYDPFLKMGTKRMVNEADVAFVCVPTPRSSDGSCDTSVVEDSISWLETDVIVIRSTVPVGFTKRMIQITHKNIVFQPEYYGETIQHPFADLSNQKWMTFGGKEETINTVIKAYQMVANSNVKINIVESDVAEFAKYMENAFLATKVIFCNEMYDLASSMGLNYNLIREVWLSDPRIGRSHTFVYEDRRGFDGKCLPKDLEAIITQGKEQNCDMTLLEEVKRKNEFYN